VNVASLAAFGNFEHMGNAGYDAAKLAVVGLTHTLSRSLGPDGIRVNVVAPGSVYTEKVKQAFSAEFSSCSAGAFRCASTSAARCREGPGLLPVDRLRRRQRRSPAGQRRAALTGTTVDTAPSREGDKHALVPEESVRPDRGRRRVLPRAGHAQDKPPSRSAPC
jgi:NAD(P)-dependent dehydrogenase (short-subunit alcohol dehydrogenase family)